MKSKIISLILALIFLSSSVNVFASDESNTTTSYRILPLISKLSAMTQEGIDKAVDKFTDMKKHWSRQYVGKLTGLEIISGNGDGTFKPDNPVQVDQFIKMTVRALGFKPGEGAKYWAQPYIDTAIQQKIISAEEFKNYKRSITRQEAARIISKAALLIEAAPNAKMDALVRSKIRDYAKIADADKQSVLTVYELGLMSGTPDGTFKPVNSLTRAEAAAVIIRYLDTKERKPFTPAADEVCIITEPDGNSYTVYSPSKIEVVKAANALKNGMPKSKGFARSVYASESDLIIFTFYSSKEKFEAESITGKQMTIHINVLDNDTLLETPYHITVYDPKAVKTLHKDSIFSLFQYMYGKEADKAMTAFDRYLDYAINGDSVNRVEWVTFNGRKALYYKVANDDGFTVDINSLD